MNEDMNKDTDNSEQMIDDFDFKGARTNNSGKDETDSESVDGAEQTTEEASPPNRKNWRQMFLFLTNGSVRVVCFCAASVWFCFRSIIKGIKSMVCFFARMMSLFGRRFIQRVERSAFKNKFKLIVSTVTSVTSRIRPFFASFVARPLKYCWNHTAVPLDCLWNKYESHRLGVTEKVIHPTSLSWKRRAAYCVTFFALIVGCAKLVQVSHSESYEEPTRKSYTPHISQAWMERIKARNAQLESEKRVQWAIKSGASPLFSATNPEEYAAIQRGQAPQKAMQNLLSAMKNEQQQREDDRRLLQQQQQQILQLQQQQQKQLNKQHVEKCSHCRGSGVSGINQPCWVCKGTGLVIK